VLVLSGFSFPCGFSTTFGPEKSVLKPDKVEYVSVMVERHQLV
jgi:hypothetical protein